MLTIQYLVPCLFLLLIAIVAWNLWLHRTIHVGLQQLRIKNDRLQLFHDLVDKSYDAMFVIDPDTGYFLEVNSSAIKSLGYTREELMRMSVLDIGDLPPNYSWQQHVANVREMNGMVLETHHIRQDGSKFPVEISVSDIVVRGHCSMLAIVRDITERKQSELDQEALTARYKNLFKHSHDALFILDPKKGVIVEANPRVQEMLGYAPEELVGRPMCDLYPDEATALASFFSDVMKNGEGQTDLLSCRGKTGEKRNADISAFLIEEGGEVLAVASVRDITDRKQEEYESLQKLSSAIEHAGESIVITDKRGIIEYVNPAFVKITGFSTTEAIGKTPRILKSGNQDASFYSAMWKTIMAGKVWNGKVIDRRKDGSFFPAMLTISSITNINDKITHYVGIHADLTEQENLEQQFHQSQKMEAIGTMVGGIAHNFNNMLAGISGNIYLAKMKVRKNPEVVQRLTNIEDLSRRAAEMIEQLLAFARKSMVRMQQISLTTLVTETLKLLSASVPENITICQDICTDDLPIKGDATLLHQVLANLINNARDAVDNIDKPCITIKLESFQADALFVQHHSDIDDGIYAHLSIMDNGMGIAKKHIKHLFDPFFTTKEQGKGTGLGLSMVYGAIKTHGGLMDVESEEGQGTIFHIYLPLLEIEKIDIKPEQKQKTVIGHGELILLADDEQVVRETTADVLESLGYKVLQAQDGQQAIDAFAAHQYDISLAILDVVMPYGGGVQLAKSIRKINANIPILFLTGYDLNHVFKDDEQIANCVLFAKPVDFDALSHSIRNLLD